MTISKPPTREWTVAGTARGVAVQVVSVAPEVAPLVIVHGIRPGAHLVVEGDAPFGGPCIVRLGRSRVAIDRRVAREIRVVSASPVGDTGR